MKLFYLYMDIYIYIQAAKVSSLILNDFNKIFLFAHNDKINIYIYILAFILFQY